MELSVVVSTLNDRQRLLPCLDAVREHAPSSTEVVVVNGPSSDGTTGAVRERDDVDVLVEISDRHRSASRNAGFEHATGETVAFLGDEYAVTGSWYDAVAAGVRAGADVLTGPVRGLDAAEPSAEATSASRFAGRSVTPFDGDNVAFSRSVVEALDGFDEYLEVGSDRDCAHRVAALDYDVTWSAEMAVRSEVGTDGGRSSPDWGTRYRSVAYRLAKNYGLRPHVLCRALGSAVRDGVSNTRAVLAGDATPTGWLRNGSDVATNVLCGFRDGIAARRGAAGPGPNPNGITARHDRVVQVHDRR